MILIKICGIAMIGLFGIYIIRFIKPEYAFLIAIATTILCIAIIFDGVFWELFTSIKGFAEYSSGFKYFGVLFRALGIGYLTVITSGICKKAGEEMVSNIVEVAGKMEILALCIPLATELMEIAKELL